MLSFKPLPAPDCTLGENPVWYAPAGEYLWTDIVKGVLYAWQPHSGVVCPVLETDFQTGAFLAAADGGLMLFTEAGVLYAAVDGNRFKVEKVPLWTPDFAPGERFNDAIADPAGQMLSGSKRADNAEGRLYRFAVGKKPEILLTGLGISNGMGFSPDGKTFYHTDSLPSTVTAYDYAPNAPLQNPRVVLWLDASVDPDGMTVDAAGNLWVVCWGAGEILRITPEGTILSRYAVPPRQCSSLCFGGDALTGLLITSASIGGAENSGGTYWAADAGQGKQEYLAKQR